MRAGCNGRPENISDRRSVLVYSLTMKAFKWKLDFFSNRVRVRILGDLSLIPINLRSITSRIMMDTMHHTGGPTLNIFATYTACRDIVASIADLVNLTKEGVIKSSGISGSAIFSCSSTGCAKGATSENCYTDLPISNSGETRLGVFLSWESGNSMNL